MPSTYLLNKFWYFRASFIVQFWCHLVISEVIMKESKVEPFSLLLNNQREILAKMDHITAKMSKLELADQKVNNMLEFIHSYDANINNIQSSFNVLSEKIDSVSQEITELKNELKHFQGNFSVAPENWKEVFETVQEGFNELNFICNGSHYAPTESLMSGPPFDIERARRERGYPLVEDTVQTVRKHTNEEKSIGEISSLHLIFDEKINKTQTQLFRIVGLLHNIEYRQHVSNVAQDSRMNAFFHKMAVQLSVLESRLRDTIREEFTLVKEDIENKIKSLNELFGGQENIFALILDMGTNLTQMGAELYTDRYLQNITRCLPDVDTDYHTTTKNSDNFVENFATSVTSSEGSMADDTVVQQLQYTTQSAIHLQTFTSPDMPTRNTDDGLDPPFIQDILSKDVSSPVPEEMVGSFDNVGRDTTAAFETTNEVITHATMEEPFNIGTPTPPSTEDVILDTVTNISALIHNQISSMEKLFGRGISATEDKLTGIRIHQASSFYSHTKEIRYEIEKLEQDLSETIRATGSKITQKLEGTRKSLFTFIDAAVTSLSSAVVTSSQSTGMQVAKQLRQSVQELKLKILEVKHERESHRTCPELYIKVGSTCLFIIKDVETTWREGCKLCQAVGGEYFTIHDPVTTAKTLKHIGISALWLRESDHERTRCENLPGDFNEELTNSLHEHGMVEQGAQSSGTEFCPALFPVESETNLTSCFSKLAVVCQYQQPLCQSQHVTETFFN